MAISDQIGVMNTAHIKDSGPPSQIYGTPHTLFTPGFMAEMDVIQAHHSLNGITTPLDLLICNNSAGWCGASLRPTRDDHS